MTTTVVYCPKCNSENVTVEIVPHPSDTRRVSIDELPRRKRSNWLHPIQVIETTTWKAECHNCGYSRTWSERSGGESRLELPCTAGFSRTGRET